MNTQHPWAHLEPITGGTYQKWETVGTKIQGEIISLSQRTDEESGRTYPQLVVSASDGERIVAASQVDLRNKLLAELPNIGQQIRITYVGNENIGAGKTIKKFDVALKDAAKAKKPAPVVEVDDDDF